MATSAELETTYSGPEYLIPDDITNRWRNFFLAEISRSAPQVIQELQGLLPEGRKFFLAIDDEDISNDERHKNFASRLTEWQEKYGLDCDQQGNYPAWVTLLVRDTFSLWDMGAVEAGRDFAPYGKGLSLLELAMAAPYLLSSTETIVDIKTGMVAESPAVKQFYQGLRETVANAEEIISPPKGYPPWTPFLNRKKLYLSSVKEQIHNDIMNHPRLSQALGNHRESFIKGVMEPVLLYCQKLENHYKEKGYVKVPNVPTIRQQIQWTVKVQVLNRTYTQVAEEAGQALPRVHTAVKKVLKYLDLAPRGDISPGRPKTHKARSLRHTTRNLNKPASSER